MKVFGTVRMLEIVIGVSPDACRAAVPQYGGLH